MACGRLIPAALLLVWSSAACEGGGDPLAQDAPGPVASLSAPKRPSDRYAMIRSGERCEINVLDGDRVIETMPEDFACPLDLEEGEWIRITGMVCMREGTTSPERNVPVVCPNPLTNAERDRRNVLGSASASAR